jgi:hypothetical protein
MGSDGLEGSVDFGYASWCRGRGGWPMGWLRGWFRDCHQCHEMWDSGNYIDHTNRRQWTCFLD